jgi:septum site-determining protein MinC
MPGDIQIHGTRAEVRIRLPEEGDFPGVRERLARRLAGAAPVAGLPVTLDAGRRALTPGDLRELEAMILGQHRASLLQVLDGGSQAAPDGMVPTPSAPRPARSGAGRPPARLAPASAGPPAAERGRRSHESRRGAETAPRGRLAGIERSGGLQGRRTVSGLRPAALLGHRLGDVGETLLLKRTLRSGQRVRFDGNVVVMGDINPGAEVVASGDIIVMGTLRGVAHAGATGDQKAIVAAFRLLPTQLRIGPIIGRSPDGGSPRPDAPEVARVQDSVVVIERYQPAASE